MRAKLIPFLSLLLLSSLSWGEGGLRNARQLALQQRAATGKGFQSIRTGRTLRNFDTRSDGTLQLSGTAHYSKGEETHTATWSSPRDTRVSGVAPAESKSGLVHMGPVEYDGRQSTRSINVQPRAANGQFQKGIRSQLILGRAGARTREGGNRTYLFKETLMKSFSKKTY